MSKKIKIIIFVVIGFLVVGGGILFFVARSLGAIQGLDVSIISGKKGDTSIPDSLSKKEIVKAGTAIAGLEPKLVSVDFSEIETISQNREDIYFTEPYGVIRGETVTVKDYNGKVMWEYNNQYPVVSLPGIFEDAVIFIDAKPQVTVLDLGAGTVLFKKDIGVFPGEVAFVDACTYYFQSQTGNWYALDFNAQNTVSDTLEIEYGNDQNYVDLGELLQPHKEVFESIEKKINSLFSGEHNHPIPSTLVYAPTASPLNFTADIISPLFVFSPQEQGIYTIGFCDEKGIWIRDKAFVVLFNSKGDTLSVSLDYVADRPQVTIHLADNELYYLCAGFAQEDGIEDTLSFSENRSEEGFNTVEEEPVGNLESSLETEKKNLEERSVQENKDNMSETEATGEDSASDAAIAGDSVAVDDTDVHGRLTFDQDITVGGTQNEGVHTKDSDKNHWFQIIKDE